MLDAELRPILTSDVTPCTGCHFSARCAAEQLACERFSMYAHNESRGRWIHAPMAPTRARFEALFS